MLKKIKIQNYKSIAKMDIDLGRINVFIGENGAGKSNILEAVALAAAASARKLDNEFLASRGIRVTQPQLMRPAFPDFAENSAIEVSVHDEKYGSVSYELSNDNAPYSQWTCSSASKEGVLTFSFDKLFDAIKKFKKDDAIGEQKEDKSIAELLQAIREGLTEVAKNPDEIAKKSSKNEMSINIPIEVNVEKGSLIERFMEKEAPAVSKVSEYISNFVIFSPENSALRSFEREGQIEPLGINGEGLLKLLSVLSDLEDQGPIINIKSALKLFGWFKDFDVVDDQGGIPRRLEILDQFVAEGKKYHDQKSANEGFLFLAFYFALFSTKLTPRFFAVDNVDASLNPKICQKLTSELVKMAKKNDKQVLMTTHNPAILDGLNLDDPDQRLYVVSRGSSGATRIRRVEKKNSTKEEPSIRLSEAFLRGALGGLPKGF